MVNFEIVPGASKVEW